jgi:homoserine acetyltransferase
MLAHTPIWTGPGSTDLADAFERHLPLSRQERAYALGGVETDWLNALRDRAHRGHEQHLIDLTNRLLQLLSDPKAHDKFKEQFEQAYEEALRSAYPAAGLC